MPNTKPRRRPSLLRALPCFLPALAAVALAAFGSHSLALLPLLLANTLCMAAMCHAIGFDPETSFLRTVLRRGATHLILFSLYTAVVFALVAWPLLVLSQVPSLFATLALCAALVLALALLWRLWPAFGLVFVWDDAFPEGEERSWISTALARSLAFAAHLTGEQEHFFSHFLPAAFGHLLLAFGALVLTGFGSLVQLQDEPRTAGLVLYALVLLPLCTLIAANRTLRTLLCESRGKRKPSEEPPSSEPEDPPRAPAFVQTSPPGAAHPQGSPAALAQALLDAARNGNVDEALALLDGGADPDALPAAGARDQRGALVLAALLPDTRLLRALIARGAQVNRAHADVTALLAATRDSYHGRAEAVMTLLANGADPRLADRDGNTPLHHAALAAEPSIAAILIDAQAPLDALNRNRHSPLGSAAGSGNWSLLKFLLEHGAKCEPAQGEPALLAAAAVADDDPQGVQILLKHKARVDAVDGLGRSALMNAALEGHSKIVRTLLDAGANVNLADRHGTTAVMEAARAGACDALEALLAAQPARARDMHGRDALLLACQSPRANARCVRALLAAGADPHACSGDGRNALEHAASAGRWDLVALLDPTTPLPSSHAIAAQPEPGADTPAHLLDALRFGHWAVVSGFAERARAWPMSELAALYLDLLDAEHAPARQWLLEHGLGAEAQLDDGARLFDALNEHLPASLDALRQLLDAGASCAGAGLYARTLAKLVDAPHAASFALDLLARGADVFGADAHQRTPLHHSACAALIEVMHALLARGADPNVRDRTGATPLHIALNAERAVALPLVRALIAHGADPESPAANGETPLGVALARSDATLEHWLRWSTWPLPRRPLRASDLPLAAAGGDADAVSKLLELGFPINTRDERGASALLRACGAGHVETAQRLLQANADAALAAESGATPLSAAVSARRAEIVTLLLEHGAKADQRLPGNATALMVGAALGFPEIVEVLLERGADATLTDEHGHTALHAAARFCFESRDSLRCRRLLDALLNASGKDAARLDAADAQGATPLLLLLGAQAKPDAVADGTHLAALLPVLLDAGADAGHADVRGVGALHACAMHTLFAPARTLLARGANRDATDTFGRTPSDIARLLGLVDLAMELAPRALPSVSRVLRQPASAD